ncbi:hypothetical protein [Actinomadura keratinilytica]|uniref:hypothetical protein n=1 Tax=Actinomadura keratinilytica TaxID=547461 RepID=UPI00360AEDF4
MYDLSNPHRAGEGLLGHPAAGTPAGDSRTEPFGFRTLLSVAQPSNPCSAVQVNGVDEP